VKLKYACFRPKICGISSGAVILLSGLNSVTLL